MSQTTAAETKSLTRGRLAEKADDRLVLTIPGTSYRLHLAPAGAVAADPGDRIAGVIKAQARRVDVVPAGGRFVEPVFGRPRRVQGRIVGGDTAGNTIWVMAGGPTLVCTLTDARQKAGNFKLGQLVSFDVEPGATFELQPD